MSNYAEWLGRSETVRDTASRLVASRMAGLLDRAAPVDGDPWPPAWTWALFWPAMPHSEAGPDGHPARGEFLPPVHLPRRMWAGSTIAIEKPLVVGEEVCRTSTIVNIVEKTGRSCALVFVTVDHVIEGTAGGLMRESQRIAYREAATPGSPGSTPQAGSGPGFEPQWQDRVEPDALLLFQYSAVTYNTHRIHYDYPYATEVEGYPGLVVHGPLTATLLMELLSKNLPGRAVSSFNITAMRPLFAIAPFELAGRQDGDRFQLVALNAANEIAMQIEGRLA